MRREILNTAPHTFMIIFNKMLKDVLFDSLHKSHYDVRKGKMKTKMQIPYEPNVLSSWYLSSIYGVFLPLVLQGHMGSFGPPVT